MQGVGFRPFVFRLASELGLTGWVRNTPDGVLIEANGTDERLAHFARRLRAEAPPLAVIASLIRTPLPDDGCEADFTIRASASGAGLVDIPPDSAVCGECLKELADPADRRHRYPFITCTNCGPRWTIITATPYDRPFTTMARFPLCPACSREYADPHDRRFHAQPLACPACGPQLRLLDQAGKLLCDDSDAALTRTIDLLQNGGIVAIKGLGGYHLAVDAGSEAAVARLRARKQRDEKPFAVMVPDLARAVALSLLDDTEARLLDSPETPIVIVRKRHGIPVAEQVAPRNGWLGLMLPATPLHHLLFKEAAFTSLVMTSANRSDEPIAYRDADAFTQLSGIADAFLCHNRDIHIRTDDSVMRVFQGRPLFYRRARGYVPRPVRLPFDAGNVLAVGAELKNAVCLTRNDRGILSQHIGDLQNAETCDSFRHTIDHLQTLLEITPSKVACDLHPDYQSTRYAEERGLEIVRVQHHHAHLASCMAENGLTGEVVGIIFDGTGFGSDQTIWGGEFLVGGYDRFDRAAHFRPVRLPGGDAAVREPWRMAMACLYQAMGRDAFDLDHPAARQLNGDSLAIFMTMVERGLNSPLTSSCGRLFDALAALLSLRTTVSYDGQAAIELEALAETVDDNDSYAYAASDGPSLVVDFSDMFREVVRDLAAGAAPAVLARRFHNTLATAAVDTCCRVASTTNLDRAVLSGGVFQNRLLSELVYTGLTNRGLQVFTHRLVPPNDGGVALGQAAIAGWQNRREC